MDNMQTKLDNISIFGYYLTFVNILIKGYG